MRIITLWLATLALAGLNSVPGTARAAQSYDACAGFIDTLPATISTQGVWCLRGDLSTAITAGNAITINTNNVTIDCNDFKLGGLAAGTDTTAYGIFANNRLNSTVRNCTIRGFLAGLVLQGTSGGNLVEDNRFDNNTIVGMAVGGDGSLVRRNRVNDTGGSTVVAYLGIAYGIQAIEDVDVSDNLVSGVAANPTQAGNAGAMGIHAQDSSGSIVGNHVRGLVVVGAGIARGIYTTSAEPVTVENNHVIGPGDTGIRCSTSNGTAAYNIISRFTTGLFSCTDHGNIIK